MVNVVEQGKRKEDWVVQGGKQMSKVDQIKLQTLVELGVRDAECARVVGCTREYVRQWKIKNGYLEPANYVEERFLKFYRQGMYDAEIAANCGVSSTSVYNWRIKNGLPPHRKNAKKYEEFLKLYKQGLNDSEIARKVGTYPATVYRWRTKNNLPANVKPGRRKRV